jgi:hypothetical protein
MLVYFMAKLSIPRPSKMYQKWGFWFENKPSGNPGSAPPNVSNEFSEWVKFGER